MTPRPDWTVTIEVPVVWGDMDAFGHINNAVYFRYFESSRIEYLRQANWFEMPGGGRAGVILRNVEARFRKPITFPDTLLVSSRLESIESDRFTLEHQVFSTKLNEIATEGKGTVVSYDYTNRTKTPIPADARERVLSLEARMRRAVGS